MWINSLQQLVPHFMYLPTNANTCIYASFTCSFKVEDGKEWGRNTCSNWPKDFEQLLQEPSCLKEKLGDKLSAGEPCHPLLSWQFGCWHSSSSSSCEHITVDSGPLFHYSSVCTRLKFKDKQYHKNRILIHSLWTLPSMDVVTLPYFKMVI